MKDEILTQLWMIKDSIAKENNNDVKTLMIHLKEFQEASGRRVVNRFQNKKIEDFGNRWLRLVINEKLDPAKGVTAFFDRRLRKQYEN